MATPGVGVGAAIFGGFGQGLSEGVKGAASYLQHQKQIDMMDKYYRHRGITKDALGFYNRGGWFQPIQDEADPAEKNPAAPAAPTGVQVSAEDLLGGQP